MTTTRPEQPEDEDAVHQVERLAFEEESEAQIVDALRRNGHIVFSLVAEDEGGLVGHIVFTMIKIGEDEAIALGPLAVVPQRQRQGTGGQLMEAGLAECARLGYDCVFVLGWPEYYPRFGFQPARPFGIIFEDGRDAFMVAELVEGAAHRFNGEARYLPEFYEAS